MSEVDEKAHYLAGIRRSRIMAVIFVSLALLVGYVGAQNQYRSMTVDKPASARIEYHVTGTSSNIRVIYLNDLAYRAEKVGTPPWKFSFRFSDLSLGVCCVCPRQLGRSVSSVGKCRHCTRFDARYWPQR